MLKVKEAAKELDVSVSWLDKMINQKLIKIIERFRGIQISISFAK